MDWRKFLHRHGNHRELAVVIHGFSGSPHTMKDVENAVHEARPDADIFTPRLPFTGSFGRFCMRPAEEIAAELVDAIDEIWSEQARNPQGSYENIVLVGHSFGSVLVRNIVLLAYGETPGTPFGRPALERFRAGRPLWAPAITRVVLLAGMSGGWLVTSAMDWLTTVQWSVASFIGDTLFNGNWTIFALRKGAPYLVQTKLQWLALMRRKPRPNLTLIQLLGTVDDLVSPDDNVDSTLDLENDDTFFLLEVPQTGHRDAIRMQKPEGPPDASGRYPKPEQHRWAQFTRALSASIDDVKGAAIPREHMADSLPPKPDENILNVVFVIHGIRDRGYWTQKVAREIKKVAEDDPGQDHRRYRSFTASYGYFAMAPFILPWVRRRKVEWLMNHYTDNRAHYPNADFSYVGHSNGTYLVARALRDYPAARFKRIVFAGSVVRRDYDWQTLLDQVLPNGKRRVEAVLNYVATRDWVVALFPKGLQPMRAFDLGSAGHDGFKFDPQKAPSIREVRFIKGSHGAGHEERHWPDIANFIVKGVVPQDDGQPQSKVWRFFGRVSTGILFLILLAVLAIGVVMVTFVFTASTATGAALWAFALVIYLWLVYTVLSRV